MFSASNRQEARLRAGDSWGLGISFPHLCACPSGTHTGITRCLVETIRTHLLQTKEKAFCLPTGFSLCFWRSAGSMGSMRTLPQLKIWQLLSAQEVNIVLNYYMKVKKRRLYIRKHICILIFVQVYKYMYTYKTMFYNFYTPGLAGDDKASNTSTRWVRLHNNPN